MNLQTNTKRTQSNTVTQAVLSLDQQFILAKRNNEITDIVCPFYKMDGEYYSRFFLSLNQLHRIQTLYEIMPEVAKYTVVDNHIWFDCITRLPDEMFGGKDFGMLHYSSIVEKKKSNETELLIETKLVFEEIHKPINIPIIYDQKVKFKADFLKAFPIILKKGFIFTTVDKQTCNLYLTILNPSENLIGDCTKFEVNNILQYLMPLWSIFDINIKKDITINLRDEFLNDLFKTIDSPILIKATYELNKPTDITVTQIGNYVKIDD